MTPVGFAVLAPVFILFDMVQLWLAERYIGIKQIRKGVHPLDDGLAGPNWVAALWLGGYGGYLLYLLGMLLLPATRLQSVIMLAVSILGFALRRSLGLKYALILLTIECAIRMGLLVNLMVSIFLWQGQYLPPGWSPR